MKEVDIFPDLTKWNRFWIKVGARIEALWIRLIARIKKGFK